MTKRFFEQNSDDTAFEVDFGSSKIFLSKSENSRADFMVVDFDSDNIKHSSIEEVAAVSGKVTAKEMRRLASTLIVLANNMPDEEDKEHN